MSLATYPAESKVRSGMRALDTIDHALLLALGKRVAALRKASGARQSTFAEAAGFDRNYWGRVERGKQNVSISTLARIARALGVDMAHLIEGL